MHAGVDLNLWLPNIAENLRLDEVEHLALVVLGFMARFVTPDLAFCFVVQVERAEVCIEKSFVVRGAVDSSASLLFNIILWLLSFLRQKSVGLQDQR